MDMSLALKCMIINIEMFLYFIQSHPPFDGVIDPWPYCTRIYLFLVLQLSQSIKTIYTKTKLTALHLANWKIIDLLKKAFVLLNTCHSQSLYKEIGAVVIKFASIG